MQVFAVRMQSSALPVWLAKLYYRPMSIELPADPDLSSEVDDLRQQVARLLQLLGHIDACSQASSIPQFCARNNISRSFFYVLKKRGKAPRIMKVDGRQIISPEAERDWRLEREREAAAELAGHPSLESEDRSKESVESVLNPRTCAVPRSPRK